MQAMTGEASEAAPTRRNWVSFWSLLTLQTQNAFNDKAAQFLLIPIGAWLVSIQANMAGTDKIEYVLAAVIVLPFILFSPLAGWFSDRYSKTSVIRGACILQLGVLIWIATSIYHHQLWAAVFGFFMLSVQSVMLSPAKRGIVKELVGHEKLGMASGLLEISVVLAICAGQIITGIWFTARLKVSNDGWDAALFPLIVLTGASVLALCVSFIIQRVPVQGHRKFKASILTEHFGQLGELWRVRPLRLSAVGAAFFWGYAGYLNLAAIGIAKQLTGGGDEFALDSAMLMLAASLGIVFGGAIASLICRKSIELGLVPLGGLVMVIGTLALAVSPLDSHWLKVWFVLAGAGGALLLVPLNANLQDLCPPKKRGKILAGLNLLDCLFGLVAVVIQLGLVALGVSFSWQFVGLAVVCVFATQYSAKLLPQHVVRLVGLGLFKVFYRVKVMNADRIPKEGGVLLTPNHVSYVDAFILSCASPRKIRFLMFDGYFKHPWIGKFVKLFDTVPISQTRAKDALRVAAKALEEGHLVCIFPEGQLTRTGCMNEFKRGFEMIARKASFPVLPASMDGLWGSIFSFERKKFIYKIPYRVRYGVTVNFGKVIAPMELDADAVRSTVANLRAEAFAQRKALENPMHVLGSEIKVLSAEPSTLQDYHSRINELRQLNRNVQTRLVANALQVGDVNAIGRGQVVMIEWTGLENCRDVIAIALAQYLELKIILVDSEVSNQDVSSLGKQYAIAQFIGGEALAYACAEAGLERGCFDFSSSAINRKLSLPCLAVNQRVISMSMPHPAAITATNQHQEGHRQGTWGRLLPGYEMRSEGGQLIISGASIDPASGMRIENVRTDSQGFIDPL